MSSPEQNYFLRFAMRYPAVKTNSFVRFLEESSAWKFAFKINWPLAKVIMISIIQFTKTRGFFYENLTKIFIAPHYFLISRISIFFLSLFFCLFWIFISLSYLFCILKYRITSYNCRGNYSFLEVSNLENFK